MLSDLLIGPSPTCQHGNRKLHRRQLPRNLSPVFRIMKRHPAPAERNHTLRDPLIRLRIPVPDTGLDQPPKDHPQNQTKKHPKPSHKPHQHTSEAHHTPLINTHPKLISQATSAHIRSSSLKSHKTVTKTPDINQPVNQSTNQANHLFP